jgi:cobyrinic acid a,c-diamide synthase
MPGVEDCGVSFPHRARPATDAVPMPCVSRLALAIPAEGPEPSVASLALLAGLRQRGWRVQHFRAWACPIANQPLSEIIGTPGRHLDAWLMPSAVGRAVFLRGARDAELAIVEGTLDAGAAAPVPPRLCQVRAYAERPGPLAPLAESLDLPVVAVVDCRAWDGVHLPWIDPRADAVILDQLDRPAQLAPLRTLIRLLAGKPVLGAIAALPEARAALAAVPAGRPIPAELVEPLARSFLRGADLPALHALAESRPFPAPGATVLPGFRAGRRFRVAYAMDEAFGGYFPDTLETLELLGAELVEFSPLRDESLPDAVDLVMIGCGFPDMHAERLAANHSLIAALGSHVCRGQRIFSEGGGTAYLGRTMIVGGRSYPGAGILPLDAELRSEAVWPQPVERVLVRDSWLGPEGTPVRGYLSPRWRLRPAPEPEDCPARSGALTAERDVLFRNNAVGGLLHLHMGALPAVVARFAGRGRTRLAPPRTRP